MNVSSREIPLHSRFNFRYLINCVITKCHERSLKAFPALEFNGTRRETGASQRRFNALHYIDAFKKLLSKQRKREAA